MDQTLAGTVPTTSVSSFGTRAANVFSAPGDLYAEVASAPVQTSSWLLPYVLSILIATLITYNIATNDSLKHQALDPQKREMERKVQEGQMSEQAYDSAVSMMESNAMFMTFGVLGLLVFVSAATFGAPLVFWLLAKPVLKYAGPYGKVLEVYGLATLVGILGAIISLILMTLFDNLMARPGAALLVMSSFDQQNFAHNLIASLNIFSIWQMAVLGIGLAKISNAPTGKAIGLALGVWIVWVLISSALGFGGR